MTKREKLSESFARETSRPRAPYRAPKVQVLGDVRSLVMGGSPGVGDTINMNVQQAPS